MFNDSEKQWFRVKVGCGSGGAADELISNHTHYGPIDTMCLQCFDAVGWAAGRASGL